MEATTTITYAKQMIYLITTLGFFMLTLIMFAEVKLPNFSFNDMHIFEFSFLKSHWSDSNVDLCYKQGTNCGVEDMTLQRGGYDCNGTCINNNTRYYNWSMAWDKCKDVHSCTRIFRWTNGSHYNYYLRKANDIFNSDTRFLHVNFRPKCRGKAFI